MKSLKTSLTISILLINIVVILLMSSNIISGYFRISNEWRSRLTTDIAVSAGKIVEKNFDKIENLTELKKEDLQSVMQEITDLYSNSILEMKFLSPDNELLYSKNIAGTSALINPLLPKAGLIRIISSVRFRMLSLKPDTTVDIEFQGRPIGKIEILTVPFLGFKYATLFDSILTGSLIKGIIISAVVSIVISFLISGIISGNSIIFAEQLTELANGRRDINFVSDSTTELKSAAAAAESLQSELKKNEELKQKRLQDIVHDLKTPITALGIQFEAVADGVLTLDGKRLKMLSREFEQIEEMIELLSEFNRIKSESYQPQLEPVSFREIIRELDCRFQPLAGKKGQIIAISYSGVPERIVLDRIGFLRIINNLVVNAINNAPENGIIKVSFNVHVHLVENRLFLTACIENEGRINEEDLPLIFDRLYRSNKSGYDGSGLGLAISKAIAEKNNGTLSVANTSGGTILFKMELPVSTE